MINYFELYNKKKIKLYKISEKICSNYEMCSEMLKITNNSTTKIRLDNEIKNSYYIFLNDTIYLSDKEKNKTHYQRICTVAHECMHSMQNRVIQWTNFLLSNVELISFVIAFVCIIFKFKINIIFYTYLLLNLISIVPRLILEIDAVIRSINLSKKYLKFKLTENESYTLLKSYKLQMILLFPLFVISLFLGRILRILVIYAITL